MTLIDPSIMSYPVREVTARFHDATAFEAAIETLVDHGINRDTIHIIASHDAVRAKLGHMFGVSNDIDEGDAAPQTIYEDSHDVANEKALAVGVPVYIGGLGAGLAVVASGGTLAFAALLATAGAGVGAGIGKLVARAIGRHHSMDLQHHLELGALILTVCVETSEAEAKVSDLLATCDGSDISTYSVTRYVTFDDMPLRDFDPYSMQDRPF